MVGSIDIYLVVEICIAFLLLANLVLTIILLAKRKDALKETLGTKLDDYAKLLEKNELNLKEEFKNNRQELVSTFANFSTQIDNKRFEKSFIECENKRYAWKISA